MDEVIHCLGNPKQMSLATVASAPKAPWRPFIFILTKSNSHHPIHEATRGIEMNARCLVTSSPRLGNDSLELVNLGLGTAESTELS